MRETVRIAKHLTAGEIKLRMEGNGAFLRMQKWLVIYNALIDPRPVTEIARHLGLSEGTVHRVIDDYNRLGPASFDRDAETGARGSTGQGRRIRAAACGA